RCGVEVFFWGGLASIACRHIIRGFHESAERRSDWRTGSAAFAAAPGRVRITSFIRLARAITALRVWELAGQPAGREQEFWYQAERELKTGDSRPSTGATN